MKEIIPIVRQAEHQRPLVIEKKAAEPAPHFQTTQARTRWLNEKIQNKTDYSSGRINYSGVDHSSGVAHTVCPYAPHFLDNIEEGIKPVVLALYMKGYLTFSSCSGHEYEPRYVSIALRSVEARDYFLFCLESCTSLWSWFKQFKVTPMQSVANNEMSVIDGRFEEMGKRSIDHQNPAQAGEIEYFNTLFYRKYTSWCFLRLQIGYEVRFDGKPPGFFKRLELALARFTFRYIRPRQTKRLAKFISSEWFPYYLED